MQIELTQLEASNVRYAINELANRRHEQYIDTSELWLKTEAEQLRDVAERISETQDQPSPVEALQARVTALEVERDMAVLFANKVEQGDRNFRVKCDEQLEKISKLPLGKTIHEDLAAAVERVLKERDALKRMQDACKAELSLREQDALQGFNDAARKLF